MGIIISFCECGRLRTTEDIREGRPCKVCRDKKHLEIPLLNKIIRKPNPAPNVWLQKQEVANG